MSDLDRTLDRSYPRPKDHPSLMCPDTSDEEEDQARGRKPRRPIKIDLRLVTDVRKRPPPRKLSSSPSLSPSQRSFPRPQDHPSLMCPSDTPPDEDAEPQKAGKEKKRPKVKITDIRKIVGVETRPRRQPSPQEQQDAGLMDDSDAENLLLRNKKHKELIETLSKEKQNKRNAGASSAEASSAPRAKAKRSYPRPPIEDSFNSEEEREKIRKKMTVAEAMARFGKPASQLNIPVFPKKKKKKRQSITMPKIPGPTPRASTSKSVVTSPITPMPLGIDAILSSDDDGKTPKRDWRSRTRKSKPKNKTIGKLSEHIKSVVSSPDMDTPPASKQPVISKIVRRSSLLARSQTNNNNSQGNNSTEAGGASSAILSQQSQLPQDIYDEILSQHQSQRLSQQQQQRQSNAMHNVEVHKSPSKNNNREKDAKEPEDANTPPQQPLPEAETPLVPIPVENPTLGPSSSQGDNVASGSKNLSQHQQNQSQESNIDFFPASPILGHDNGHGALNGNKRNYIATPASPKKRIIPRTLPMAGKSQTSQHSVAVVASSEILLVNQNQRLSQEPNNNDKVPRRSPANNNVEADAVADAEIGDGGGNGAAPFHSTPAIQGGKPKIRPRKTRKSSVVTQRESNLAAVSPPHNNVDLETDAVADAEAGDVAPSYSTPFVAQEKRVFRRRNNSAPLSSVVLPISQSRRLSQQKQSTLGNILQKRRTNKEVAVESVAEETEDAAIAVPPLSTPVVIQEQRVTRQSSVVTQREKNSAAVVASSETVNQRLSQQSNNANEVQKIPSNNNMDVEADGATETETGEGDGGGNGAAPFHSIPAAVQGGKPKTRKRETQRESNLVAVSPPNNNVDVAADTVADEDEAAEDEGGNSHSTPAVIQGGKRMTQKQKTQNSSIVTRSGNNSAAVGSEILTVNQSRRLSQQKSSTISNILQKRRANKEAVMENIAEDVEENNEYEDVEADPPVVLPSPPPPPRRTRQHANQGNDDHVEVNPVPLSSARIRGARPRERVHHDNDVATATAAVPTATATSSRALSPPQQGGADRRPRRDGGEGQESRERGRPKLRTKKTRIARKRSPPWNAEHPVMRGRGKALYNKNLVSKELVAETLANYGPPEANNITPEQEASLHSNLNQYVRTMFDGLCDNAPRNLYYGVWSFQQMLTQLKKDGLLDEDATEEEFVAMFKDTVGREGAKDAEGFTIPKPGKSDIFDIYN